MRRFFQNFAAILFVASCGASFADGATPVASPARQKTTVCSITINSADEISAFRDALGERDYDYIELTTLEGSDGAVSDSSRASAWFRNACRAKIQCDVLIVSGHFGGSFFGTSGFRLALEDLERGSCDAACDGVLQRPKEVFLMGCNTLAGKHPDSRTPEQYRDVLIEDGFSSDVAEQVVAARYSPLGSSFSERMQRVFRGAPRIYGFESIGPSGKKVKPLLAAYLKRARAERYYLPENLRTLDEALNGELAKALATTSLTQSSGAAKIRKEQIPVCYLESREVPLYLKLNWIEKQLNSDEAFQSLPAINEFLASMSTYQWTEKEFEVLERVTVNSTLRKRLESLVAQPDVATMGMQLRVLTFMKFFGWIAEKEFLERLESTLLGDLRAPLSSDRKDQICSYAGANGLKLNLKATSIPMERWEDPQFIGVLSCLGLFNPGVYQMLLDVYVSASPDSQLYSSALSALHEIDVPRAHHDFALQSILGSVLAPLNQHQSDLLCGTFKDSRPMLTMADLPQSLKAEGRFVKGVGCYIRPNLLILSSVIEAASKQGTELGNAGAETLRRWGSLEFSVLDRRSISHLAQLAKSDRDGDLASTALALLSNVRDLDADVLAGLLEEMTKLAERDQIFELFWWASVFTKSDVRRPEFCTWLGGASRAALKAHFPGRAVALVDPYLTECESEILQDHFLPELLRQFASLSESSNQTELVENPKHILGKILLIGLKLRDWKELWAVLKLNDLTYDRQTGHAVQSENLLKLVDHIAVGDELSRNFAAARIVDKEKMIRVLSSLKVADSALFGGLEKHFLNSFKNQDLYRKKPVLLAMQKQNLERTVALFERRLLASLSSRNSMSERNQWLEMLVHFQHAEDILPLVKRITSNGQVPTAFKLTLIAKVTELNDRSGNMRLGLKQLADDNRNDRRLREALDRAIRGLGESIEED